MDVNINGNPGTGNSYSETKVEIHQDIKIGSVGQYINHAERVEYDFGRQKGSVDLEKPKEATSADSSKLFDRLKSQRRMWTALSSVPRFSTMSVVSVR